MEKEKPPSPPPAHFSRCCLSFARPGQVLHTHTHTHKSSAIIRSSSSSSSSYQSIQNRDNADADTDDNDARYNTPQQANDEQRVLHSLLGPLGNDNNSSQSIPPHRQRHAANLAARRIYTVVGKAAVGAWGRCPGQRCAARGGGGLCDECEEYEE